MSDIIITLLLIVPIFIVFVILNKGIKRGKKKAQKRINAYIAEATRQTGITNYYRKQLVHQTVIMDESSRKLLIIYHKGEAFTHDVYPLDAVKETLVVNDRQSFVPKGKGQKPDHITTKIGVKVTIEKNGAEHFLTLYDYLEHSTYQMADLEKEACQLHDKIKKAKTVTNPK